MNPWLRVFLPFAVGYYLSYLLRNVNAVIAPELTRDLGVGAADLGLLTSAYLLAFGAFQLPLGILLDRYGPRRVEATLLLVAAAGTALFALGTSLGELAFARALIGLGVSACLMASFKAFSLWFPAERLPSLNAAVMAAGGLGALTATTPIGWALPLAGWRGVFLGLTTLVLLAALAIFTTPRRDTPMHGDDHPVETVIEQVRAVGAILASRVFWRYAPQTTTLVGGFMALQGLWAVPWLMTFNGLDRGAAANHLLLTSIAMLGGFLAIAFLIVPLKRRGITPDRILAVGMGLGVVAHIAIVLDLLPTQFTWFFLGLVFAVGNLAYALLAANFPPHLSGRVNTALNLGAFVGAFGLQWGFGVLVEAAQSAGLAPRDAFRLTYGALVLLQAASWGWFMLGARKAA
ncbi:MAG: MFS transporter [Gammaproteobacteria bacterium]|nr:MFS transporter [Gammaproteobacteria bacterium]MBU1644910.1 MFS transporter [Gammaproteobacteria bacterium]MBU1971369.1 MFS transporter [Gammaproteobacteria bacterium]